MHSLQKLENRLMPRNAFHTPQAAVINFLVKPSVTGLENAIEGMRELNKDVEFVEESKRELIRSCFLDKEARRALLEYVKRKTDAKDLDVESEISKFLHGMVEGYERVGRLIEQCERVLEESGYGVNEDLRKHSLSDKFLSRIGLKEKSVVDSIKEFFPREKWKLVEERVLKAEEERIRREVYDALRSYVYSREELREVLLSELRKYPAFLNPMLKETGKNLKEELRSLGTSCTERERQGYWD